MANIAATPLVAVLKNDSEEEFAKSCYDAIDLVCVVNYSHPKSETYPVNR